MLAAIAPLGSAPDTPLLAPAAPTSAPARSRMTEALGELAASAAETLRAGESAAAGAMTGEVSAREAVDRVMEAERTLRAAVAVRDKLVSGWLDISRMQI